MTGSQYESMLQLMRTYDGSRFRNLLLEIVAVAQWAPVVISTKIQRQPEKIVVIAMVNYLNHPKIASR